ncbi:TPA: hypothetical protein TX087_000957 [Streptococcus suis]|nr:hypothetical protein [Streptococcus suis]
MDNFTQFAQAVGSDMKVIKAELSKPTARFLVGPGRPDKPETTAGVISGSETSGTVYMSTDGADVGAWEWIKRGTAWVVTNADTGWRKIATPGLTEGYLTFRRINNQCMVNATGGRWGTVTLLRPENNTDAKRFSNGSLRLLKVGEVPVGFRSSVSLFLPIAHDGKVLDGTMYLAGTGDSNWLGIHNYKDIMQSAGAVMRLPMLTYISDEAWPDVLPGVKM